MAQIDIERWRKLPFFVQMANIGSEVGRTKNWIEKSNPLLSEGAFVRALDLFDITIQYAREGQKSRYAALRELCRARELFTGAYIEKDLSTLSYLDKYLGQFALAVRR